MHFFDYLLSVYFECIYPQTLQYFLTPPVCCKFSGRITAPTNGTGQQSVRMARMRAPSYRALDALDLPAQGETSKANQPRPRSHIVAAINCCKIASPAGGFAELLTGGTPQR